MNTLRKPITALLVLLAVLVACVTTASAAMSPIERTSQYYEAHCLFYTTTQVYGGNAHDPTEFRIMAFKTTAFNCDYPTNRRYVMGPRVCSWVDNGGAPDPGPNLVDGLSRRVRGGAVKCASPTPYAPFNTLARTLYCLPGQTLRLSTRVSFDLEVGSDSDSETRQYTINC